MKELIRKLLDSKNLTREENYELFKNLQHMQCEQQAAIIALLRAKKESVEELIGARDFLFKQAIKVECPFEALDIVGTGGDGMGTFNISTAASIVIASCGVYVAKHGGRNVTSQSGSMDVLEYLGLHSNNTPEEVISGLATNQYTYIWAPVFNNALKTFGSLRKVLGFPTIFNILGPLLNPTQPKYQVIGVYRKDLVRTVAETLRLIGSTHALVVHSDDGLDELSISAPTTVAELKNGTISEYTTTPIEAGLPLSSLQDVIGGTPKENAEVIVSILAGKAQGPHTDIVLLNSAAGLLVAGKVKNLKEGVAFARNSISSGKTLTLLNKLKVK